MGQRKASRAPHPARKLGDWVWLAPYSGFVGESDRLKAEIVQDEPSVCMLGCRNPECQEWPTLWTEPDPDRNGERHMLCHVSECQMYDHPVIVMRRLPRWRQVRWYKFRGKSERAQQRKRRQVAARFPAKA